MKIILLTDVKNVGKKGDVKEVADGYARNYLIRNHLAVESSKKSIEILENQKQKEFEDFQNRKEEALKLKQQLSTIETTFKVKAGSDGKLFGSVSTAKIAEQLQKEHGITVDKRKFVDNANITKLGKHQVKVELFKDVIAELTVNVLSE